MINIIWPSKSLSFQQRVLLVLALLFFWLIKMAFMVFGKLELSALKMILPPYLLFVLCAFLFDKGLPYGPITPKFDKGDIENQVVRFISTLVSLIVFIILIV